MNRFEFMRQLEMLLSDVSPNERSEAIQFYNDYFDDAGTENEQEVIQALGSPAKVAATIKADLTGNATGEFTETGYQDFYNKGQEIVTYNQESNSQNQGSFDQSGTYQGGTYQGGTYQNNAYQNDTYQNGNGYQNDYNNVENGTAGKKSMSGGQLALLIVLCVFAAPILIPIAAGIFGVLVGLAATLFGLFVAFAVVSVVLIIVGIVLVIVGFIKMFVAPFGGLCLAGSGLVCAAVGILFCVLCVWLCAFVIPLAMKGIVKLCNMPHKKKRGTEV